MVFLWFSYAKKRVYHKKNTMKTKKTQLKTIKTHVKTIIKFVCSWKNLEKPLYNPFLYTKTFIDQWVLVVFVHNKKGFVKGRRRRPPRGSGAPGTKKKSAFDVWQLSNDTSGFLNGFVSVLQRFFKVFFSRILYIKKGL